MLHSSLSQRLRWLREYWGKEDVRKELADVETFMEPNNYYWCLWAVVQSGNEGFEEFDYGRYAFERSALMCFGRNEPCIWGPNSNAVSNAINTNSHTSRFAHCRFTQGLKEGGFI